jgi:hypothetical protein
VVKNCLPVELRSTSSVIPSKHIKSLAQGLFGHPKDVGPAAIAFQTVADDQQFGLASTVPIHFQDISILSFYEILMRGREVYFPE